MRTDARLSIAHLTRASLLHHFGLSQSAHAAAEQKVSALSARVVRLEWALARAARMPRLGARDGSFCRFCFLLDGAHVADCFVGSALSGT